MHQIARTPDQLGSAIKRQRRRMKLSQASLAERTSLRQATISAVEAGNGQLNTICDVLAALGLELVVQSRVTGDMPLDEIF